MFLGILVDSVRQQLRLPDDKLRELQHAIISWLGRRSASKRRLLSIIGKLAFAARVVPAGRLFLRRLIDLSTKAKKLHHHVKLNSEARPDFQWWHTFLLDWNGVAMFLDPAWTTADQMELYTDASGTLGYGAYFQGHWFRAAWEPLQRPPFVSIQWQELFAVVTAARTWGHCWMGRRIVFHCDNMAIVNAWSHKSSRDPAISSLLRTLFLVAAQDNFNVSLRHLLGKNNALVDALSRNQMNRFFTLAPHADPQPTLPTSHC